MIVYKNLRKLVNSLVFISLIFFSNFSNSLNNLKFDQNICSGEENNKNFVDCEVQCFCDRDVCKFNDSLGILYKFQLEKNNNSTLITKDKFIEQNSNSPPNSLS